MGCSPHIPASSVCLEGCTLPTWPHTSTYDTITHGSAWFNSHHLPASTLQILADFEQTLVVNWSPPCPRPIKTVAYFLKSRNGTVYGTAYGTI